MRGNLEGMYFNKSIEEANATYNELLKELLSFHDLINEKINALSQYFKEHSIKVYSNSLRARDEAIQKAIQKYEKETGVKLK